MNNILIGAAIAALLIAAKVFSDRGDGLELITFDQIPKKRGIVTNDILQGVDSNLRSTVMHQPEFTVG